MKPGSRFKGIPDRIDLLVFLLLAVGALGILQIHAGTGPREAGQLNFTLGFLMMASWAGARVLSALGLPKLTGYILVGMTAGPHVLNILTHEMTLRLGMVNDLAVNFIGLAAGATLRLSALSGRGRAVASSTLFIALAVFFLVFSFLLFLGPRFALLAGIGRAHILVLALLTGVLAVARSPSSAIAVISECRAQGPFTQTILGVTLVTDVLIIILFTVALTVGRMILMPGVPADLMAFAALLTEIIASMAAGILLGKAVSAYMKVSGRDLALFLVFFALGISRASDGLDHLMTSRFGVSLHLEPLLLCMATGFFIQNFSPNGPGFLDNLNRFSLPVYLLFFSLAGASLNLAVLPVAWPLAVSLVLVRAAGIYGGAFLSGVLAGDPPEHRNWAGMTYLTQAGVSIGLAQLACRQFPEIGDLLTTIILAVIAINQIIGPIALKAALVRSGESPLSKQE
ncbi:MAG: cation:proton antiporter [Proteobacteria bacterium]|nr:cation:proton antiporter [Pseudomonadota bacterium]